ncbi:MAG: hypothetical protein NVS4B9_15880 [Ktedonobacteraceae bacterium]
MAFSCRAMIGGKTFEITNGNGLIKFASPTHRLTWCRTDSTTNTRKRIAFGRNLKSLIIAAFSYKADIETGVRANRARCLTGSTQVFFAFAQPGTRTLPGLMPFRDMPASLPTPWRFSWLLWNCTRVGIERLPSVSLWQKCE